MQGGGGEDFLVGRHRGGDGHRLQRMDDIGKSLAPALGPGMGADGEYDRAVQEFGIQRFISHSVRYIP